MATVLSRLCPDVRDRIWHEYLGKNSVSVALLKCTSEAMRKELRNIESYVSPNDLHGCSLAVIESVMQPIDTNSVDWYHWEGLICNAAAACRTSDVIKLLALEPFRKRLEQAVNTTFGFGLPSTRFSNFMRAFYSMHVKIVKAENWDSWCDLHDALTETALRNLLLSFCFVLQVDIKHERALRLFQVFCKRITRGDALDREVRKTLAKVGHVIGHEGDPVDLAAAATFTPACLLHHLRLSCATAAMRLDRVDAFLPCLLPEFPVDLIERDIFRGSTKVLEFALRNNVSLEHRRDDIAMKALERGNGAALKLLSALPGYSTLPGWLISHIDCADAIAWALLRSVDDARIIYACLCKYTEDFHALSHISPLKFCTATWEKLLLNASRRDANCAHGLGVDNLQFFLECVASRVDDKQQLYRDMLRMLVQTASFTEVVADELLRHVEFKSETAKNHLGNILLRDCIPDVAFDWVLFHFKGVEFTDVDATICFEDLLVPDPLGKHLFSMDRFHYFRRLPEGAKLECLMRWLRFDGDVADSLSRYSTVVFELPLSFLELILDRALLNNIRNCHYVLQKILNHFFNKNQKRLYRKFYDLAMKDFKQPELYHPVCRVDDLDCNRMRHWLAQRAAHQPSGRLRIAALSCYGARSAGRDMDIDSSDEDDSNGSPML